MPDFGGKIGGGPSETGANTAASRGVTLTASASNNTKGSWVEVIASLDYNVSWLMINLTGIPSGAGGNEDMLIDIGTGAAAAETVLIANLFNAPNDDAAQVPGGASWLFPMALPAGTRIAARMQCRIGSVQAAVAVTGITQGIAAPSPFSHCETIGADTANSDGTDVDPGGVAHTKGAWVQLIASTAHPYRWLCLDFGSLPAEVPRGLWLVDVGIGGSGSEVVVIGNVATTAAYSHAPPSVVFPCAIPAGSRVSVRAQCNGTNATQRILQVVGHGVG